MTVKPGPVLQNKQETSTAGKLSIIIYYYKIIKKVMNSILVI